MLNFIKQQQDRLIKRFQVRKIMSTGYKVCPTCKNRKKDSLNNNKKNA